MRLKDLIDQDYLDEVKSEIISSKIFIPEIIRSFLTREEINASFDESLRERYGQEKMAFRDKMDSIYISLDLLNFIIDNNYWGLVKDKNSLLNFLKEMIEDDFEDFSSSFSIEKKRKYAHDYNLFLNIYNQYI